MKDSLQLANTLCLQNTARNELLKMNVKITERQRISCMSLLNGDEKENTNSCPAHFGCSLDDQLELVQAAVGGRQDQGTSAARCVDVPAAMFKLCEALRRNDRLDTVGLFRIPGGQTRMRLLRLDLENGDDIKDDYAHTHDIADLLKTFIRRLPDPLLPGWTHKAFINCMKLDDDAKLKAFLLLCCLIPSSHLHTLIYLMHFLHEVVCHSEQNKMCISNICAMMTPNIMHSGLITACSAERLADVGSQLNECYPVVQYLIEINEYIGYLPDEIYDQVCGDVSCAHSCDESMLWSHNSALISMDDGNRSQQRKRGLSGRVGTKLGKLMPKNRQKTPCKKETLERSLHNAKICRKRPSDAHDSHVQAAKRRSLQSPLSVKDIATEMRVAPVIVVSSMSPDVPKFEASPTPNCKFTDEDETAAKQFSAEGHDRSCTKDHERPRSAKKLFNKFMRVRRRESGNTSCFCVKQQNATSTQIERHHSRFRRSLQRSAKRKSVDVISVPVVPQSSKSMECLDAPSLNYGDGKNEKGSFFKRVSSPQPSPNLYRRRSSGKFGMVSRLASSMTHSRKKSRKSDVDLLSPNCLSKQKTKSETGSDHTRSTDTLDSLSSDNTAETLDALDEDVVAETQEILGPVSRALPQTSRLSGVADRVSDEKALSATDVPAKIVEKRSEEQAVSSYRNGAFERAAGDICTSSEEDSLSTHPESIFDLSIDTLLRMNDPTYKRESRSLMTKMTVPDQAKEEHLLTPVRENYPKADVKQVDNNKPPVDMISPIGNSAAALSKSYLPSPIQPQAPSPIMPVQHTPSPMRIDSDYGASPSLLDSNVQKSKGAVSPCPSSPALSSASSSSDPEETFDDSLGEVYKKFEEVDLSFQEIAVCPKKSDGDLPSGENNHRNKWSLPSAGSKSRVARLRTSTRAAVLHSSPAEAPRVGNNAIRKVQSLHGRPINRTQVRTSSSMRGDINTHKNVGVKMNDNVTSVAQPCQPNDESKPYKSLMQHTSTSNLLTQAAQACVEKRKSSNYTQKEEITSPIREVQQNACTPKKQSDKTVVRRNRTPASRRNRGTPHSITRSRVISRRSGGQLPRLRGLHRGPYSPKAKGLKNVPSPARTSKLSSRSGSQFGIQLRSGSMVVKSSEKNHLLSPHSKRAANAGKDNSKTVVKTCTGDVSAFGIRNNAANAPQFPTVSLVEKDPHPKPVVQASTLSRSQSMRQKCDAAQDNPLHSEQDVSVSRGAVEARSHRKSLSAPGTKWSSDSSLYLRSGLLQPEKGADEKDKKERRQTGYVSEFIHRFNELAQRNAQVRESMVNQRKAQSFRATSVATKPFFAQRNTIQRKECTQTEDGTGKSAVPEHAYIADLPNLPNGDVHVSDTSSIPTAQLVVPILPSTQNGKKTDGKVEDTQNGKKADGKVKDIDILRPAPVREATNNHNAATIQTPKIKQPLMKLPKSVGTKPKKQVDTSLCSSFDMLSDYSIIEAEETPQKNADEKGSLIVTITTPVIKETKEKKKSAKRNRMPTPNKAQKREALEVSKVGANSTRRSPLIIRNLNTQQDFLDNSPVRRATPTRPRSREPIKPTVPDPERSDSPAKSKKAKTPNKAKGLENSELKPNKSARSGKAKNVATPRRGPGAKKLCKSLEALDSPKSLAGKKSKQYYSVSAKDLSTTISNPMTVVDSRSVKHTAL